MRRRDVDPEKLLEMIRSILPSRARVVARLQKAGNRRVVRRSIHQALQTEDHFMRWCEALTEGLSDGCRR